MFSMKKLSVFIILILSIILALTPIACKDDKNILTFWAFNTEIRIESPDKSFSSNTEQKLSDLFSSLENEFSVNEQNSLVSKLNQSPPNTTIELSQTGKEIISLAKEFYTFTDGKFNPAVAPLVKLWQFDNFSSVAMFAPPEQAQIQNLLNHVDFNSVIVDGDYVYKTDQLTKIDFGGLIKGYAVDKALEILLGDGHQSGYVNLGNSSMALLSVKTLNVAHPRASKDNSLILSVDCSQKSNVTLSTSGDYQRFHEYQGARYSHIIDSRTGYPIQTGIASATIIGGTGAFSDAVTTALCITEHNPSDIDGSPLVEFMKKILLLYPESELYVVYDKDGVKQILTNKKQGENFTLLDDDYSLVNI